MESKKKYLTQEEYEIILNNIPGLIVVDDKGYLKYLAEDIQERLLKVGKLKNKWDYLNRHIDDIHPLTKIVPGTDYGKCGEFVFYQVSGVPNISKIKNMQVENKVVGSLDYDIAWGQEELSEFLNKIDILLSKSDFDLKKYLTKKEKNNNKRKKYSIRDIIGTSKAITKMKEEIYKVSKSEATVLISGETGSGKELVAQSIHRLSKRGQEALICINCASIPENLLESEFFGYEEGAFSGAKKGGSVGKFEIANGSTIFLDEINKLHYNLQSKLLRVLQEKEIDKIGGKIVPVDVRVIAATNVDLLEMVKNDMFREDLYYRLNVLTVKAPPLRERKEDIPELVDTFLKKYYYNGDYIPEVSDEVYDILTKYNWPGNVRELFNILERAVNNCDGMFILPKDLELSFSEFLTKQMFEKRSSYDLIKIREEVERETILEVLQICNGNKKKTAEMLNITRANLYSKIEKYKITY